MNLRTPLQAGVITAACLLVTSVQPTRGQAASAEPCAEAVACCRPCCPELGSVCIDNEFKAMDHYYTSVWPCPDTQAPATPAPAPATTL
jgi:hypothetical protein